VADPVADASIQGKCSFQGTVTATAQSARVKVSGQPVLVAGPPPTVAGCTFTTPSGSPLPCLTVTPQQATRVKANQQPILLVTTGWKNNESHPPAPVVFQPGQQRVKAT
jgi:hypothetical protein